jgi:preprotein translocase subunit SecA
VTIFKLPEDVPLEHAMVSRAIEQAQVKVEGFNFDTRKHLVDYDDILNKQREIIYGLRRKIVAGENLKEMILEKLDGQIETIVRMHFAGGITGPEKETIIKEFISIIPFEPASQQAIVTQLSALRSPEAIIEFLKKVIHDTYIQRETQLTSPVMRQVERWVSISVVDSLWMDHLDAIEDLREGIGLRGYGQLDPLVEYKHEAYSMFERLLSTIDSEISNRIFKVQVQMTPQQAETLPNRQQTTIQKVAKEQISKQKNTPGGVKKLGRNDPCPCGSGKKWKRCHYPKIP